MVCEAGNYRIYVNLCLGGGITGSSMGAADDTRTMAFSFYSSNASMSLLSFTPAMATGDSSGISMVGVNYGPAGAPFGNRGNLLFLDPGGPTGFMCVSSINDCGMRHTQCDQYSFLVNALPDSIRLFGAEGNGNPMGGCFMEPDMVVALNPAQVDAGLDTLICRGDTISLGGNPTVVAGPANVSYTWMPPASLNNPTLANPLAWPQVTTTFSVTATAQGGCPSTASDSVTVTVDTACVWPGDCNYDLVANYLDVLNIGLTYGFVGPIRPVGGNVWQAHAAYDWGGSFLNGPNHKHADSNGDGLVNTFDIDAILANYGLTHTGNRGNAAHGGGIYFYLLPDTVMAGDTLWLAAGLGTATDPVDSVYGLGFQLFYPPALVDSGGIVVQYDSSWLGTESVDMVTLDVDQYQSGVLDVALTRIDHVDTMGYGEICRIGIAMQDDISGKVETFIQEYATLAFYGAIMTSAEERRTVMGGEIDSVLVLQNTLLPVEWLEFRGLALESSVQLDWTTATESNSEHFQVERAVPGGNFEGIGIIPAAGNSSELRKYRFVDTAPFAGENIYRIAETDRDGAKTYSAAISILFGESSGFSLAGPPLIQGEELVFSAFSPENQIGTLRLHDLQGRELVSQSLQFSEGSQAVRLPCGALSAGVYLFHLQTASTGITYKLIQP